MRRREGVGLGQGVGRGGRHQRERVQGHKGWDGDRESSRWSDPAGRGLKCVRRSPSATGPAGMFLARKRQREGQRQTE